MTPTPSHRPSASLRRYATANRAASLPVMERFLHFIGADLAFADDVLGDLAQERARRAERDGTRSANWWYVREGLRSAPHLALNAVIHGGPSGRARVAFIFAAIALALTLALMILRREPTAVRLEVDGQSAAVAPDGVIVNTRHPVQLAMRALDAEGETLKSAAIRYQWMSGEPISVSTNGIITCSTAGDALLRASVGAAATTVRIKCLPVREVLAHKWIQFAAGDSSQELSFVALDPDGMPVQLLAGAFHVKDSTIATLKKGRIYPLSPGRTQVTMRFGDGEATTQISVFERITTFEGLRDDQRFVIAPVRLASGESIRWPLPRGLFWLKYHRSRYEPAPTLSVHGPVMCMPAFDLRVERVECLVRGAGASVEMTYSAAAASAQEAASCEECRDLHVIAQRKLPGNRGFGKPRVEGALSLEQQKYP